MKKTIGKILIIVSILSWCLVILLVDDYEMSYCLRGIAGAFFLLGLHLNDIRWWEE